MSAGSETGNSGMPEKKIKHLEMIEIIIERMARNSFALKGWTMTLVAAVSALASRGSDKKFMLLAFIPILGFWILDAFYVQQERRFKQLYKNVTEKSDNNIDFSMDTNMVTGTSKEMERLCFCRCIVSPSVVWFYPIIAGALIVVVIVLKVF